MRIHNGLRRSRYVLVAMLAGMILASLSACGQQAQQANPGPPLPKGWTLYRDSHYPFQMPVPPGWRTATMYDGPSDRPNCTYVVGVFMPGDQSVLTDYTLAQENEFIYLMLNISCPDWATIGNYTKQPGELTVSGQHAKQYDVELPQNYGFFRTVVANIGGHSYTFQVRGPEANKQVDYAIFAQMLKGFVYSGH